MSHPVPGFKHTLQLQFSLERERIGACSKPWTPVVGQFATYRFVAQCVWSKPSLKSPGSAPDIQYVLEFKPGGDWNTNCFK